MKAFTAEYLDQTAKALFQEERAIHRLEGWFLAKERALTGKYDGLSPERRAAEQLYDMVETVPLFISDNAVFAGTERDAFARSYALINPAFSVKSFSGYCDPMAVFNDVDPSESLPKERIEKIRALMGETEYAKSLVKAYKEAEPYTAEVVYFFEQVTGHLIPDFRYALSHGVKKLVADVEEKLAVETDEQKADNYKAFLRSLEAYRLLCRRYAEIAQEKKPYLAEVLKKIENDGADDLFEALQAFMLLWQVMNLEQAPNPFAFSVGNADRIFEPYRAKSNLSRAQAAGLFKHFLVFFNVGDRSWAISQNILVGGKSAEGKDLTNPTTYALLDAYYEMNLPQPILSVKLHKNTPDELYEELGKFFFTPGALTPSIFNDDTYFVVLRKNGVKEERLADYSVAGCQEPLIMGRDNANTTNSWLNMAKILEVTLGRGKSLLTGKLIEERDIYKKYPTDKELLENIQELFEENLAYYTHKMCESANAASVAVSKLPVPFLSCFMGGVEYGYDVRDTEHQSTEYNGSGCLIHGLSIVADSLIAIRTLLRERPEWAETLVDALRNDFVGYEELREFLKKAPKYGNAIDEVDDLTAYIASLACKLVKGEKNYLGNSFRPDFASPSTHLTYGYWVAATPDGRNAREMLGYGIDPLFGEASNGLGFRILSNFKLPFAEFCGGYASHIGVDPKYFEGKTFEEKGLEFKEKIIAPVFFNEENPYEVSPGYLYFNITTAETLRKVLADPKKYAPNGVYIMRIHGTFVNFLDLSPEIQEDIIKRLDD